MDYEKWEVPQSVWKGQSGESELFVKPVKASTYTVDLAFNSEKRRPTLSFRLFGLEKCRSTLSMAFYENVRPETTV